MVLALGCQASVIERKGRLTFSGSFIHLTLSSSSNPRARMASLLIDRANLDVEADDAAVGKKTVGSAAAWRVASDSKDAGLTVCSLLHRTTFPIDVERAGARQLNLDPLFRSLMRRMRLHFLAQTLLVRIVERSRLLLFRGERGDLELAITQKRWETK